MGNAGSTAPGGPPRGGGGAAGPRFDELARTSKAPQVLASLARCGHYAALATPAGATVHLLGAVPCSSQSEEEAFRLVSALRPSHVYVDLTPEWAAALQAEVAAGRVGEWAIPDATPPYQLYPGAGVVGSVLLRNQLADNQLLGLMGAEWFGPWKAALEAVRRLGATGGGAGGAGDAGARAGGGGGAAPSSSSSPVVLAFPFSMHYNNGELLDRPAAMGALLVGNSSFSSDAVHALVGNNAAIMAGEPAEAEYTAAIPP
jgi:hypothetical protein